MALLQVGEILHMLCIQYTCVYIHMYLQNMNTCIFTFVYTYTDTLLSVSVISRYPDMFYNPTISTSPQSSVFHKSKKESVNPLRAYVNLYGWA